MKTICFIRHGKSSWKDPALRDIERPLNKRGLRDAPFMANILVTQEGVVPDIILSSPAKRAFTTATYFAGEAGIDVEDIRIEDDIYEATANEVLSIIDELDDGLNTVFVFGHNPTFTYLVNIFLNGHLDNLPTTGIGKITFAIDRWRDVSAENVINAGVYYPKQYQP